MKLKLLAACSLAALVAVATPAQAQTEIQWWHSMGGALGERVNELANEFNASQKEYKVVPIFKGTYPESMTAAIAAFRAGNAPHILQVFEVGTATMMAAKGAIVPVGKVMKDAGEPFDPRPTCRRWPATTPTPKGNMLSFPFNSSTPVFYINKDAFKKAGLDPDKAPKTWKEVALAAAQAEGRAATSCVYTTGWPSGCTSRTSAPGTTCRSAPRRTASAASTRGSRSIRRCTCATSRCSPTWRRRACSPTPAAATRPRRGSLSGECAMFTGSPARTATSSGTPSSTSVGQLCPTTTTCKGAPQNSIIGGASLWVMAGKKPDEYKGVAKFFAFLSQPEVQVDWPPAHRLRADHAWPPTS